MNRALNKATAICKKRGVRLTDLRLHVLEIIWAGHKPQGAYHILETLRRRHGGAQPPTVYRALDFLLEQGLVHRLESLNSYVGCNVPEVNHAGQFLICGNCGLAAEINDNRIEKAIRGGAAEAGFAVAKRTIEVEGICPICQQAKRAAANG
ncbi:MAG TPA: transcriptional repressor [Rhodospirillales bacterium]|jgi:Fur family zinc uptake transcriptional regulator|nr:transcriptional repressor [Rhodospirillales bacterium]